MRAAYQTDQTGHQTCARAEGSTVHMLTVRADQQTDCMKTVDIDIIVIVRYVTDTRGQNTVSLPDNKFRLFSSSCCCFVVEKSLMTSHVGVNTEH